MGDRRRRRRRRKERVQRTRLGFDPVPVAVTRFLPPSLDGGAAERQIRKGLRIAHAPGPPNPASLARFCSIFRERERERSLSSLFYTLAHDTHGESIRRRSASVVVHIQVPPTPATDRLIKFNRPRKKVHWPLSLSPPPVCASVCARV